MNRPPSIPAACVVAGALLTLLQACGGDLLSGPPQLHLGRDECSGCGMIINEDRCSCAMLVERGGAREHVTFDDIGCMLEYETEQPGVTVLQRYVHDYASRAWVPAESAWYVTASTGRLATPMGSGLIAFEHRTAADAKGGELAARTVTFEEVRRVVSAKGK